MRIRSGTGPVVALLAASALALVPGPAAALSLAEDASRIRLTEANLESLPHFVDGVVGQQLASREVAGAVVAAVANGRVLFTRGYGFADVDRRIVMDPARTLIRPGSTSKLFTWTALLQLVEAGRVDLDAEVNAYLDFRIRDTRSQPILVRHLLDHRPGFEDRSNIRVDQLADILPLGQWLAANIPDRVADPGTETAYSNYATALAGYIVERVSGEPFASYVEKHLFQPLGMNRTTFREPLPAALASDMAKGYDYVDGRFVERPFELYSNIMPAGSGSSTATDMTRFMLAHLQRGALGGQRILRAETVRRMHSTASRNAPGLPGFAHGFYELRQSAPRIIGHGGNTAYFHSMMWLAPEADFGLFVSYSGGDAASTARTELVEAVIGRLFPEPIPRAWAGEVPAPPLGAYRSNRRVFSRPANPANDVRIVAAEDQGLTVEIAGVKSHWVPAGDFLYRRTSGARAGGPHEYLLFHRSGGEQKLSFVSQPMVLYRLVDPASEPAPAAPDPNSR